MRRELDEKVFFVFSSAVMAPLYFALSLIQTAPHAFRTLALFLAAVAYALMWGHGADYARAAREEDRS